MMPGNLDDARREVETATDRLVRADQRLRDFAIERRVWGTADAQQHQTLRAAAQRARQQRDAAVQQIIQALGADDE